MLFWHPNDDIELDPVNSRGSRVTALRRVADQLERENKLAAQQRYQVHKQLCSIRSRFQEEQEERARRQPVHSHKTKKRTNTSIPPMSPAESSDDQARSRPRFRPVSNNSLAEKAFAAGKTLPCADDDSEEIRRIALLFNEQVDEEVVIGDEIDTSLHSPDSSISLMDTSDVEETPEDSTTRRRMRPPLPQEDVLIRQHLEFL